MPARARSTDCTVALVGNPNTGKSTLFSALAGIHQRVGNYPGVTVEKKTGRLEHQGLRFELIDLPGVYSLVPRSLDERVAVDVLLGRADTAPVDVVLAILDASNLQRNLYLLSQVLEQGLSTVVALNMLDVAESRGQTVDAQALAERLGVPVVPVQAHRRYGLDGVKAALARAANADATKSSASVRQRLERQLSDARRKLTEAGRPADEVDVRHAWAAAVAEGVVHGSAIHRRTMTDRLDHLLTHRLWGTVVLVAVMMFVFQAVFVWAEPPMTLLDGLVHRVGGWLEATMNEGPLRSLLVDGVVGGVGALVAFVPQIAILFFFIAILEDCGYLARGAFLLDRFMSRIGLSGKSFVPMLSSFACAVPGIMAARVVENERDRLTTILVAPLLTCSARLPVYALLIAAFVPNRSLLGGLVNVQGLCLAGLYLLGIVAAVGAAVVFKRTLFRGQSPMFFMELPSYKWPSLRTALLRVLERVVLFFRCAGTLILAISILTWAAVYYPHNPPAVAALRAERAKLETQLNRLPAGAATEVGRAELRRLERQIVTESQRQSWLGRAGRLIEPVVRPLGWDWRIGCAVIASFPAREVVVASLGVIFSEGVPLNPEADQGLQTALRSAVWEGTERPLFSTAVALSIMVFFALCAQCVATLAMIRRETNSWRWPAFTFAYMTLLAYAGALATYQLSSWIGLG
jgi:ferrous iron transport protein B